MKTINGIKLYTAEEVAALLGVGYTTALKYMKQGRMARTKVGHKFYVSEQSLMDFLNGLMPIRQPQQNNPTAAE